MCAEQNLTVASFRTISETLEDTELVMAAKAGSAEAFETLQNRYRSRLYRRLLLITRNREDAEDALQETFLNTYIALRSFEGRSKFSSWITRIAINSALTILRKGRVRGDVAAAHELDSDQEPSCIDIADSGPNPEQSYDQRQRCLKIFSAIQSLDSKLGSVIQIRALQECSIDEVAQTLNVSASAAKTRLYRARQLLRRSLGHKRYGSWVNSDLECTARELS
jgi:RNA polymerase sigma-70 factor (ECF subfamily)